MRIKTMSAPRGTASSKRRSRAVRSEKEASIEAQEFEKAASLRATRSAFVAEEARPRGGLAQRGDLREAADRRGRDRRHRLDVDGHPGLQAHRGGDAEADPHGGRVPTSASSARRRRSSPSPSRSAAPAPVSRTSKRPTGSFIFLGPSGVGKTESARTLAEFLFGDEDDDPGRHVGVHGEALRVPACRLASGLHRL